LFDEDDIAQNLPKAEAAARKLRKINSSVEVEGIVADLNPGNAVELCRPADLILDGTDNLETRYLINDLAVKHRLPWIYGACIEAEGLVLPILPGRTPCLSCIWEDPPPPGVTPTCDTVGVLASAVQIVASLQATEAMKLLMGLEAELNLRLSAIDAWSGRIRRVNVQPAFDEGNCPCCKQNRYEFLEGTKIATSTTLCGRNAVQVRPAQGVGQRSSLSLPVDFSVIAGRLPPQAGAQFNEFMLRFTVEGCAVTVFGDGRAIVQGTADPTAARGLLAKYVGW
jgi:adenylyltransferase/sulfurtransferase